LYNKFVSEVDDPSRVGKLLHLRLHDYFDCSFGEHSTCYRPPFWIHKQSPNCPVEQSHPVKEVIGSQEGKYLETEVVSQERHTPRGGFLLSMRRFLVLLDHCLYYR
jgi:hypothetical protein